MKIIILTPVKNEAWIIETFLKIVSHFADHIILADQNSTDNTLEIASSFSKVVVIKNESIDYDEASRQNLLIGTARQLYGNKNILLALDADEILAANSIHSSEWQQIFKAKPGSVFYFEKPTFYGGLDKVIRYQESGGWPLGFKDDGSEHNPKLIHSTRVPIKADAPKIHFKEIKYLHCNLLSLHRQRAKLRYYCMLEAINKTKPWHRRITYYNAKYNYSENEGEGITFSDKDWVEGWIKEGIKFPKPKEEDFYWYDEEALKLFDKYGSKKFWLEDVWDIDWNKASGYFDNIVDKITYPPASVKSFRLMSYHVFRILFKMKTLLIKYKATV